MSNAVIFHLAEITQRVESQIGYLFEDPFILLEALQTPGSIGNYFGNRPSTDDNKRLALLGNTALQLVLLKDWYAGGGNRGKSTLPLTKYTLLIATKGAAGNIICQIGSKANLSRIGRANGLHHVITDIGGLVGSVTLPTTVQAIIGAVFLDGGLDMVKQVMVKLGLGNFGLNPL